MKQHIRRKNQTAGGITIFTKEELNPKLIKSEINETIGLLITKGPNLAAIIGTYKNAKHKNKPPQTRKIKRIINEIKTRYKSIEIIVAGDLNLDVKPRTGDCKDDTKLREFLKENMQFEFNEETRMITRPITGRAIDHIIMCGRGKVKESAIIEGFENLSDHLPITKTIEW
jgi:exonuclease III